MEILLPENTSFNLNQPSSKLIDSKMCVFDYANKEDMDFYMKKITSFISYRYPSVDLLIGGKYHLELPLNWRVMICNNHDYICQLVPIEELLQSDMINNQNLTILDLGECENKLKIKYKYFYLSQILFLT